MKATTDIDGEPPRSQATWLASLAPALSALTPGKQRRTLTVGRPHPTEHSGPPTVGILFDRGDKLNRP